MTVRSLQHVALAVPDLALGHKFYGDFGLEGRAEGNRAIMRCHGRDQDQVVLVESRKKRLHHVCFGAGEQGLADLKERLEQNRVRLLDAPNETPAGGLWFRDPDEQLVNVRVAEAAPWRDGTPLKFNYPNHYGRVATPWHPKRDQPVRPRRLSHVLCFTPDVERKIDFYTRIVGLKLSDRARSIVAFLRAGEGPSDHHIFALLTCDRPGFHHASFEVGNIDEIGIGANRLLDKGYRDGWGFGRHVIGSNFFHYVRDPWNSLAEYSCDIDHIPGDYDWKPTDFPPEDALYVWGPKPPADFGANFEEKD
ncbi:MAG: VOC family protein [Alphaproteobacteria bacterium]|nr:VOC family protein [Alphaproteobacteria bacterium]